MALGSSETSLNFHEVTRHHILKVAAVRTSIQEHAGAYNVRGLCQRRDRTTERYIKRGPCLGVILTRTALHTCVSP
jgi:hypothetical protein